MGERAVLISRTTDVKKEKSISKAQKTDSSRYMGSPVDSIMLLQRTIGNQAVSKLIKSGALQANLKVKLKTSPDTVMPSCDPCRSDWETIVDSDHDRALNMLDIAISKLASYDGTTLI